MLEVCLRSVDRQSFRDFEIVVVNDGSTDSTAAIIERFSAHLNIRLITHPVSVGVTRSRQDALHASTSEFVALLDDDDEWLDENKLERQVAFLQGNSDTVLVGGASLLRHWLGQSKCQETGLCRISPPENDSEIRKTMLLRNNFSASTVMFRRASAMSVGGFIENNADGPEDYDLWLRLGTLGKMCNFPEPLDIYRVSAYPNDKIRRLLRQQLKLIARHKQDYPFFWLSSAILRFRITFCVRTRLRAASPDALHQSILGEQR